MGITNGQLCHLTRAFMSGGTVTQKEPQAAVLAMLEIRHSVRGVH